MKYELLNIFHILQDETLLFVYEYEFRQKLYYGVATESLRENLINSGLVDQNKVIHYDFLSRISELYDKVAKNNS